MEERLEAPWVQPTESTLGPEHCPPHVHVRVRVIVPFPHVVLHGPLTHDDHELVP